MNTQEVKTTKKDKLPVKKDESLFSLVQLSHAIQEKLVETMGELTPEIEREIAKIHEKLPDKADGYKFFIDDLKAQSELWSQRAFNFTLISKSFMSYIDRLKYSLKMACIELGVEQLEGSQFRWKLVNNAPSLIVDDEKLVPAEFKEIVQTTRIRTDMVKEVLKNGGTVPGTRLETGNHVRPYPMTKVK